MIGLKNEKHEKVRVKLESEKEKLIELLPKQFQDRFRDNSFIGGGAIYSLYNGNEPKDIDLFITDEELVEELREYFFLYITAKDAETKDKKIKIGTYRSKKFVLTDNAITIDKFQIITKWIGEPEEVINEFDFAHNMFYVYKGEIDTFSQWDFLDDNLLRFNNARARDISGCIIRTKKFVERGFKLTNKEMAKMLLKLNDVGFNKREIEILEHAEGDFY